MAIYKGEQCLAGVGKNAKEKIECRLKQLRNSLI